MARIRSEPAPRPPGSSATAGAPTTPRSSPTAASSTIDADPSDHHALAAGLPHGVIELAARRWRGAERLAPAAGLWPPDLDDRALVHRLGLELTAPLRLEDWPAPNKPRAVTGGWINDEVVDEDRSGFEALVEAMADAGPEELAATAQELRWPITPYRRLADRPETIAVRAGSEPERRPGAQDGPTRQGTRAPVVVDLSTHWAGPLATALLAEAGAEVVKIDPSCRPDGFRERPTLYHHLNGAKEIVDLDLRRQVDRNRFESLVAGADLLVESFSRRVLPNLGYGPDRLTELNPALAVVSIKAFPATGPEAHWLAYGPGVHAASGLGWLPDAERPRPAPVAYPDLLAAVTAYATATALLGPGPNAAGSAVEVTLAGSIIPLVEGAVERSTRADG